MLITANEHRRGVPVGNGHDTALKDVGTCRARQQEQQDKEANHLGHGRKDRMIGATVPEESLMSNHETLRAHMELADQLIELATKAQIAETARLLALNLAHYESKYGALPIEEQAALLDLTDLDAEQAALVIAGLRNLAGVLGMVMGALGNDSDIPRHERVLLAIWEQPGFHGSTQCHSWAQAKSPSGPRIRSNPRNRKASGAKPSSTGSYKVASGPCTLLSDIRLAT